MRKFSNFVVKNKTFILIISLLMLIPSIIGYIGTKINYDILVYLPDNIKIRSLTRNFLMNIRYI